MFQNYINCVSFGDMKKWEGSQEWWLMPVIQAMCEAERKIMQDNETYLRKTKVKISGGLAQEIECLPSQHEFKPQYCQKEKKGEGQ
jgi:hypothetical protein